MKKNGFFIIISILSVLATSCAGTVADPVVYSDINSVEDAELAWEHVQEEVFGIRTTLSIHSLSDYSGSFNVNEIFISSIDN